MTASVSVLPTAMHVAWVFDVSVILLFLSLVQLIKALKVQYYLRHCAKKCLFIVSCLTDLMACQ